MPKCDKEWDAFEDALKKFSEEVTTLKVAKHECEEHKDESICMEMSYLEDMKRSAETDLQISIKDLNVCLTGGSSSIG